MGAMQHCLLCPGTHQRSHWGAQLGAGRGARAGPHPACVSVPGELGGSQQRTAALGHLPLSGPSPRGSRRLLQHPRQPFLWGPVPPQAGSTHPAAGHEGVGSLPPPGWSSGVSTALCCPRGGWGGDGVGCYARPADGSADATDAGRPQPRLFLVGTLEHRSWQSREGSV